MIGEFFVGRWMVLGTEFREMSLRVGVRDRIPRSVRKRGR